MLKHKRVALTVGNDFNLCLLLGGSFFLLMIIEFHVLRQIDSTNGSVCKYFISLERSDNERSVNRGKRRRRWWWWKEEGAIAKRSHYFPSSTSCACRCAFSFSFVHISGLVIDSFLWWTGMGKDGGGVRWYFSTHRQKLIVRLTYNAPNKLPGNIELIWLSLFNTTVKSANHPPTSSTERTNQMFHSHNGNDGKYRKNCIEPL